MFNATLQQLSLRTIVLPALFITLMRRWAADGCDLCAKYAIAVFGA